MGEVQVTTTRVLNGPGRLGNGRSPWALGLFSGVVVGLVALTMPSGQSAFQPYFGDINPVLATGLVALVGAGSLALLVRRGWPGFLGVGGVGAALKSAAWIGTAFALPTVLVDYRFPFPQDINAALPQALLFYPAMGYVAEIAFHVLPLACLVTALAHWSSAHRTSVAVWQLLVPVALIEPAFQVWTGWSTQQPRWVSVYVAMHLFLFGLFQLRLYTRHGLVAAYALRLVYYAHWHVLWGWARLQLVA